MKTLYCTKVDTNSYLFRFPYSETVLLFLFPNSCKETIWQFQSIKVSEILFHQLDFNFNIVVLDRKEAYQRYLFGDD